LEVPALIRKLRAFSSQSLVSPGPIDFAGGPVTQRLMGTFLVSLR
jgi:hypothetical protein